MTVRERLLARLAGREAAGTETTVDCQLPRGRVQVAGEAYNVRTLLLMWRDGLIDWDGDRLNTGVRVWRVQP